MGVPLHDALPIYERGETVKTRTYQFALAAAVAACILLAGALGYVLMHRNFAAAIAALHLAPEISSQDPVVARGPAMTSRPAPPPGAPSNSEPALAPLQLSPQRMQEIGVTTATVEMKEVNDDLSVPGNVDIDEQKLSYVQIRFPGWIQDVSANARSEEH